MFQMYLLADVFTCFGLLRVQLNLQISIHSCGPFPSCMEKAKISQSQLPNLPSVRNRGGQLVDNI